MKPLLQISHLKNNVMVNNQRNKIFLKILNSEDRSSKRDEKWEIYKRNESGSDMNPQIREEFELNPIFYVASSKNIIIIRISVISGKPE